MIRLENVSAGYNKKTPVLKDISLVFEEGGVCGILGPNGAGKTTLLKVLAGLIPYSGSIQLDASELSSMSRKKHSRLIAMMPQFSSVYFSYTVYETVMLGRYVHREKNLGSIIGNASIKDKEIVEKALDQTGLTEISKKDLSELSGGQLQRVMLARTIAQETPVILLDEPTNHLDLKHHNELMDYLKKWSTHTTEIDGTTHKNTAITVFHDLGASLLISDDIMLMKKGEVIKKGPLQETLTRDLLNVVYDTDVAEYYSNLLSTVNALLPRKVLS